MVRVSTIASWSALVIGAEGCGSPDYATWVGRADATANSSPALPATVEPALLAYWRFDDGVGTAVMDSSGRGHDGAILGNGPLPIPVWTTGKVGGALALDGQTFVRVPYSSDWDELGATNAFTVVAWVVRQTTAIGWSTLVSRQYQQTTWEHFELSFKDDHAGPLASTQINQDWYCNASAPTVNGLWTHIAGTYDGTTLRGYQNGIEVCNLAFSTTLTPDDTGVVIGGENNMAGPIVNQLFTGLVDELAIYSRAFGPSEIAELAAGKPIAP
jgi:hypothetical protein